jgi:DNA repair protein RadD
MSFIERPYQKEAAEVSIKVALEKGESNIIGLPTGTGKTIVMAGVIDRYMTENPLSRVLVLSHVKEILEQNYDALVKHFGFGIGIYASGLGWKETHKPITVASIQTVARNLDSFKDIGLVVIDEAHMVNNRKAGSYRKLLEHLDHPLCIGLTASPFRTGQGYLFEGKNTIFKSMSCDYTRGDKFRSLIKDGYLIPLIGKRTAMQMRADGIKMTAGDFNNKILSQSFDREEITRQAVHETINFGDKRKKWLVFGIDIEHAENITRMFNKEGVKTAVVHSKMDGDRSKVIKAYKNGEYKCLVNVDVLTTGFDDNTIDLISMMRPTASGIIHVQTSGRGTRPMYVKGHDLSTQEGRIASIEASGKTNCLLLDFGGNVRRLGTIDEIYVKPPGVKKGGGGVMAKECKKCHTMNHLKALECISCGADFELKQKLKAQAEMQDAMMRLQ